MRALGGETAWIYWKFVVMMSGFAPVVLNVELTRLRGGIVGEFTILLATAGFFYSDYDSYRDPRAPTLTTRVLG
jgi:hypothetical protein